MNIGELAVACFAYSALTGYADSFDGFVSSVDGDPDLSKADHRQAMLRWLNQWGCRQFSLEYHTLALSELLEWYHQSAVVLPETDRQLWELSAAELEQYAEHFDRLSARQACIRERGGKSLSVTFGPTAAAKILFALRPKVFVAWDEPMRREFRYDGSGRSYVEFLLKIRLDLLSLRSECQTGEFELSALPRELDRPYSTPAQLVGEYYWVTVTRQVKIPKSAQVQRWASWLEG